MTAALNSLAVVVPDWLRTYAPHEWSDRYGKRVEDFHIPQEATKCVKMMEQVGSDGFHLLQWVREEDAPKWLREIPAVEMLRRIWIRQFYVEYGQIHQRPKEDTPPASRLIVSPCDGEARMSIKRDTKWTGYVRRVGAYEIPASCRSG